ncbi:MAG: flagellar hook-basal body complex protein [Peptostreptococcaceae bacterium]|nr:flagellar hook-basal body complex protein [Peptostreptococcaceae bacterium]
MIRGLYTAASGMIVQQKRQENVSNNIANIETPSFKKQTLMVMAREDSQILKSSGNSKTSLGTLQFGLEINDALTDFSQGLLKETGRPEDLAIEGRGFFKTELISGQAAYTRNGSIERDGMGYLVNSSGFRLFGKSSESGGFEPIQLDKANFAVDSAGNITDSEGKKLYTLDLVDFEDLSALVEVTDGVYILPVDKNNLEIPAKNTRLVSGVQEASNVNALEEMVKLIEIARSFESNQRVIQSLDEILGMAVSDIGRV